MAKTVDELRNEIRLAVDRFERRGSTGFTKESLAAISEGVGADIGPGQLPAKADMREEIARRIDGLDDDRDHERPFRKTELETIAAELGDD
ncbi:hypothetical protein HLRTI_003018 [Halorhabdus tiamatea SARL4B]|uniref:Uncharacterized protein n=1 Tax=Halorhabdus tiamatea SARL4B TaxID=1033806 RepID=U2DG72_9EURY|nr:hypothetical protein [Halorhabdus tiamatea]ERJ05012.1 hypothetical protein HLRTI_003018 [Halorhabdus tiamatea SARL4B]